MKKFKLHFLGGKTEEVEGTDIADACRRAGIGKEILTDLNYYEERAGKKTKVAGQASCGCVYGAEEGRSCQHDLNLVGLAG